MKKKIWVILTLFILFTFSFPYLLSVPPLKKLLIWIIEQKVNADIQIDSLRFCWLGPQKISGAHLHTPQIDAEVSEFISDVPFWQINKMGRSIKTMKASGTTNIEGRSGQFSIQGSAPSPDIFNFRFSMIRMPTKIIDLFFNTKGLALSTIGSQFDASGSASSNNDSGDLNLDLSSPNTTASIRALFTPEAITLQQPLNLSLFLTPELSKSLTKGALSIQSVDPVFLQIQPRGFFLPRKNSLQGLQIPKGSLNLGRIRMENAKFLMPLAKFLKANISMKETDLWLTNADFSIKDQIFRLGRTDALIAKSVHVCAWGDADLAREQLDMIFGIPADTLSKSLGIQNVSTNYVLQIPVTGSFSSPQFDTKSATAKITALLAIGQTKRLGGVFGGVGDILGKISEEKAPPAKRPFPWER